jgi:hypothetical protein
MPDADRLALIDALKVTCRRACAAHVRHSRLRRVLFVARQARWDELNAKYQIIAIQKISTSTSTVGAIRRQASSSCAGWLYIGCGALIRTSAALAGRRSASSSLPLSKGTYGRSAGAVLLSLTRRSTVQYLCIREPCVCSVVDCVTICVQFMTTATCIACAETKERVLALFRVPSFRRDIQFE